MPEIGRRSCNCVVEFQRREALPVTTYVINDGVEQIKIT